MNLFWAKFAATARGRAVEYEFRQIGRNISGTTSKIKSNVVICAKKYLYVLVGGAAAAVILIPTRNIAASPFDFQNEISLLINFSKSGEAAAIGRSERTESPDRLGARFEPMINRLQLTREKFNRPSSAISENDRKLALRLAIQLQSQLKELESANFPSSENKRIYWQMRRIEFVAARLKRN